MILKTQNTKCNQLSHSHSSPPSPQPSSSLTPLQPWLRNLKLSKSQSVLSLISLFQLSSNLKVLLNVLDAAVITIATAVLTSVISEAVSLALQVVDHMLTPLPALNRSLISSTVSMLSHVVTRLPQPTSATIEMTVVSTLSQSRVASPLTSLTTQTATITDKVANRPTDVHTRSSPSSSQITVDAQLMLPASAAVTAAADSL